MRSRAIIAGLALTAAAAASVATDYSYVPPPVLAEGPHVVLEADRPQRYVVTVEYSGGDADLPAPSSLYAGFDPRAGRWLGNPELTVTITDLTLGDELATGQDRQAFNVIWEAPCYDTASCSRSYAVDLELTTGREAEIDWNVSGWVGVENRLFSDSEDTGDTDAEPVTAIVTITGPE